MSHSSLETKQTEDQNATQEYREILNGRIRGNLGRGGRIEWGTRKKGGDIGEGRKKRRFKQKSGNIQGTNRQRKIVNPLAHGAETTKSSKWRCHTATDGKDAKSPEQIKRLPQESTRSRSRSRGPRAAARVPGRQQAGVRARRGRLAGAGQGCGNGERNRRAQSVRWRLSGSGCLFYTQL